MLKAVVLYVLILLFFLNPVFGQKKDKDLKMQGDSTYVSTGMDPLGPSKAAFYSAILPGLGQAYNKKYWKIPLVYAALGTGTYFYLDNRHKLERYQTAYKQRIAGYPDEFDGKGENPYVSDDGLVRAQQFYRQNKDLSLFITLGLYALNIIEANVDAHLDDKAFSKDLTIRPSLFVNPVDNSTVAGIYINFDF